MYAHTVNRIYARFKIVSELLCRIRATALQWRSF